MANNCPRRPFPGPRLPQELIDLIIDHLHDDLDSLKACSLVCKSWTRSTRFHLFSELGVQKMDAKRFLKTAPAIIPFIRHLCLGRQKWDETLPRFVGLESIRSISLYVLPAHSLGSEALSALFHNFSAAVDVRLEEVQFATASELVRFICAFPCLQRLSINCAGPQLPERGVDLPAFRPSPHLRVLELDDICMDAVLDWFLALPDRPALHSVGLHPYATNNPETVAKLLSALENSLEHFFITTSITDLGSQWPFDLRRHTRLRTLQVEHFRDGGDVMLVAQLLSQISSVHMEEVGLDVNDHGHGDDRVGQDAWNEVDAVLQHPSFSGLRMVNIRFIQVTYGHEPNAVSWITERLPRCHARGLLRIREMEWEASYFLP